MLITVLRSYKGLGAGRKFCGVVSWPQSLKQRGILLYLFHLDSQGHIYGTLLTEGFMDALGDGGIFADTDHALRWCENRLLCNERPDPVPVSVPISGFLLTHGLTPSHFEKFSRRFPHIANSILANMIKILGERLRDAARVINSLEN